MKSERLSGWFIIVASFFITLGNYNDTVELLKSGYFYIEQKFTNNNEYALLDKMVSTINSMVIILNPTKISIK
jgi:hypothetical protein